jgi:hypothetical protein
MKQQSPTEAQTRAVECLADVQKCLSSFVRDLGGTDPQTAEVLVEVVGEKLAGLGQELVANFSGALQQGRDAIAGPQSLGDPLAQRPPQAPLQATSPEEPSDVAALLAKLGGQ